VATLENGKNSFGAQLSRVEFQMSPSDIPGRKIAG